MMTEQKEQTQALFVLNIIFGVATIVMDLMVLFVRRGVLTEIKEETSPAGSADSVGGSSRSGGRGRGLEMEDVYQSNGYDGDIEGNVVPTTANPMQAAAMEQLEQREREIKSKDSIIEEQTKEIEKQREEIECLKREKEPV